MAKSQNNCGNGPFLFIGWVEFDSIFLLWHIFERKGIWDTFPCCFIALCGIRESEIIKSPYAPGRWWAFQRCWRWRRFSDCKEEKRIGSTWRRREIILHTLILLEGPGIVSKKNWRFFAAIPNENFAFGTSVLQEFFFSNFTEVLFF